MLSRERPQLYTPWLLATLRWLFLVAIVAVVALDPGREANLRVDLVWFALLLIAIIAANFAMAFVNALGRWPRATPALGLALDGVTAAVLYAAYGGAATPLLFVGILPVITCALRFDLAIGVLAAFVMIAAYGGIGALTGDVGIITLATVVTNGILLLIGALTLGWLAAQVRAGVQQAMAQVAKEEQSRAVRTRERARAIYDMASTLSATLNYEKVLQTALDVCEIGMHEFLPRGARMVGMVLLFQEDQLQIVASRHLTRTDLRVTISGEGTIIQQALKTAEAVVVDSTVRDADLKQIVALQDCHSVVCLPLRAGFENYGLVVFGTPEFSAYGEEQLELFNAVANQATIALQNARLYQSLLEEKERIIEIDEESRKKLARDLHDGPTQNVAAIAMRTNFTLRLLEREPQKASEELRKIEELARQTTREMRHMLFTLRPLVLESQGLTAALQQLADKLRETYGLNIILETTPFEQRVDAARQGVAFYIVEEAVGNARKHAQAQHIWVRLGLHGDLFIVQIEDDGVGFEVARVEASYDKRGSLGMVNMRERAALVNGTLHIQSAPGKGTRITVAIPLTQEAEETLRHAQAAGDTTPPPSPPSPPVPPPATPPGKGPAPDRPHA